MRRRAIPASLYAAAAGIDPWRTRHEAWSLYVEPRAEPGTSFPPPPAPSAAVLRGLAREDEALAAYAHVAGVFVNAAVLRVHGEYEWLAARADGIVVLDGVERRAGLARSDDENVRADRRVVETKVRRRLDTEVPPHALPQLVGEMACNNAASADYVCMEAETGRVCVWRVAWPQDYWDWLLPRLANFWDCVTRRTAPSLDSPSPPPRVATSLVGSGP